MKYDEKEGNYERDDDEQYEAERDAHELQRWESDREEKLIAEWEEFERQVQQYNELEIKIRKFLCKGLDICRCKNPEEKEIITLINSNGDWDEIETYCLSCLGLRENAR